jgi:hypothetical protein
MPNYETLCSDLEGLEAEINKMNEEFNMEHLERGPIAYISFKRTNCKLKIEFYEL